DPPSRVARLSYVTGDVSMQPAGIEEWSEAHLNRPLITGDSLYTDRASRVELEVGAATLRLDERTTFRLLNLDDSAAQVELTGGTLNLTVRHVFEGQTYEVDTPTLALVIDQPGQYRIDIAPKGDSTMVSVIDGDGEVYGRDNASFQIRQGESYRFYDSQLKDYEVLDLPRQDDFDQWCSERADRYERSPSRRYVSEDTIGYADLDDYGSWSSAATYGSIWYPSRVEADWTPYRNGHWSWIDPWGWTWVDDAPWGFAPSHYGRWAYVESRWGWVPGPRNVRPIYAPALVAFVGGGGFSVSVSSGGPVGWFPLGPLTTSAISTDAVSQTTELALAGFTATNSEIAGDLFHNEFTGPAGFYGLKVLARNNNTANQAVILGGGVGTTIGTVPEPGTLSLFGVALLAGLGLSRRSRAARQG
ncbi:MAG: DUF6600 domain-containing protein, partial [Burkholderiaceae bacterium]